MATKGKFRNRNKKKTKVKRVTKKVKNTMNNVTVSGVSYEKSVQEPWFSLISMGVKKVEGRPKKGFFDGLKRGDIVTWTNDITGEIRRTKTLITGVRLYKTFHDMISKEGLVNVLPATGAGIKTIQDGVDKVYRQWYTEEIEKKLGVCAIEMKLLDNPNR